MELSKDEIKLVLSMFNEVPIKGLSTIGAVMQLTARLSQALKDDPPDMIFEDEKNGTPS